VSRERGSAPAVPTGAGLRPWTLPNLVTLVRLGLLPVLWWLLVVRSDRVGGAVLLAGLASTDWVDGQLARRLGQVSTVGKVLDPTADRLLIVVAVVAALVQGDVPVWLAGLVVAREAIVVVGVVVLAAAGAPRIDVHFVGKAGTFVLMASLPLFVLAHAAIGAHAPLDDAATALAVVGLLLAWVAAASYLPAAGAAWRARGRQSPAT
jgi:cardiolipin synthase